MSLRAIKKRSEAKIYSTEKLITNPIQNVTTSTAGLSEEKAKETNISKSYPDLSFYKNDSLIADFKRVWNSDTDITKLIENFEYNKNLISAKSEIYLRTISEHKTPQQQMSQTSSKKTSNRRCIEQNATLTVDIINNNNSKNVNNNREMDTRRLSENRNSLTSSQRSTSTTFLSPTESVCSRGFADTSCVRIPIIGYEVMEERARFTVYKLRIENPFTNDCWLVLRRYTDFLRLNNKLKLTFPTIHLQLPRKKLFGDNFNSVFLDNRVQGLQMFINSVMGNEELRKSKIVREFFCLDESPTYSESMEECRAIFEAQEETIAHLKILLRSKDEVILQLQQKLKEQLEEKDKSHLNDSVR